MKESGKKLLFLGSIFIVAFVESVNLFAYTQIASLNRLLYWVMFILLVVAGIIKLLLIKFNIQKCSNTVTGASMILSILTVLFMAMTREAYAVVVIFILLVMKGLLLLKCTKI